MELAMAHTMVETRARSMRGVMVFALAALALAEGCGRSAAVQTASTLPLRRVVVYRNGVGYFERQGHVDEDEVHFRVAQREVGDFLATLAVMERGGSSVRAAAFPMPEETPTTGEGQPAQPRPEERRTVRLALDGRDHDLLVGYTVETPIWRPSYRLVFNENTAQVQAWGIVQNLSGEDWTDVRLSLVAGSPVSFRSELAQPVVPPRPVVTDQGAVIDAVPMSETTLAQAPAAVMAPVAAQPPPVPDEAQQAMEAADGDYGGLADRTTVTRGAGRAAMRRAPVPSRPRAVGGAPMQPGGYAYAPTPSAPPPPPPTSSPRNVNALAALAAQGGSTRYDLPNTVTVPDRSATMVMLAARDIPGSQMYLFAPDGGVAESVSHPFHVARFENRTGALLERGPIAIFEQGAYLGQGMLDPLPDGATTTVPFSLERAIAVENNATWAVEGSRLVRMQRESLTVERYSVQRVTYRVRNGMDREVRVMVRQALNGAQIFEPPTGTEQANNSALVPVTVPARGSAEQVVTLRTPMSQTLDLSNEQSALAIEAYLRDGHPADDVATALRTTLDLRRQIEDLSREYATLTQRRQDLEQNAEETRENLRAIQRNPTAADLRAQLTARLARVATEVDQVTRRVVELDTQIGERRVRLAETVRGIDVDTSRAPSSTAPAVAPAAPTARPRG